MFSQYEIYSEHEQNLVRCFWQLLPPMKTFVGNPLTYANVLTSFHFSKLLCTS